MSTHTPAPGHPPKKKSPRRKKVEINFSWAPQSSKIGNRVLENFGRVLSLISLYRTFRKGKGRTAQHYSDILRSSVVLMHATLEDGLRSLMRHRLPRDRDTLDTIGLVGLNDHGRPEKFTLGELCRFKDKTVSSILEESVDAYLEKQSFNNRGDVCRVLKILGIDPKASDKQLTLIAAMIARRHKIVHYADIDESKGPGHHFTRSINANTVRNWNSAVRILLTKLCSVNAGHEATVRGHIKPVNPAVN